MYFHCVTVAGDYHDQPIEAGTSYRLTANNNINVAIILIDVHDADRRSFSFIPPYSTTATKHSVYIPLYSGVSPLMKEFEVTKLQSYYVHTNKTSSLSAVQTVTGEMLAHHETYSFENYYSALVVFNANNNWMTFAGPRVFNSGQYLIEMVSTQCHANFTVNTTRAHAHTPPPPRTPPHFSSTSFFFPSQYSENIKYGVFFVFTIKISK